jgi:hypothetical protein
MSLFAKIAVCTAWISFVAVGFGYAWKYEATQGISAAHRDWPDHSSLALDSTKTSLVLFAHPDCPCTLVSVRQLAELLDRRASPPLVYVVIVQPPGLSEDLRNSVVAKAAKEISGAIVVSDSGGKEAKRFGAATSGQLFAFGPDGKERFRGGITSARGHYGPSDGLDALTAVLNGTRPNVASTPVYGCSLLGDIV